MDRCKNLLDIDVGGAATTAVESAVTSPNDFVVNGDVDVKISQMSSRRRCNILLDIAADIDVKCLFDIATGIDANIDVKCLMTSLQTVL